MKQILATEEQQYHVEKIGITIPPLIRLEPPALKEVSLELVVYVSKGHSDKNESKSEYNLIIAVPCSFLIAIFSYFSQSTSSRRLGSHRNL
jgi:hypothetical protein